MKLLITQGIASASKIPKKLIEGSDAIFSLDGKLDSESILPRHEIESELENKLHICWTACRELLVDFTSAIHSSRHSYSTYFNNLGQISKLPFWHLTGLGKRDPEVRNRYFYNFTYIYFLSLLKKETNIEVVFVCTDVDLYKACQDNFKNSYDLVFVGNSSQKWLQSFKAMRQGLATILVFILTKLFLKDLSTLKKNGLQKIFFLTIHPISWIRDSEGSFMERHLSMLPFKDADFNMNSVFLILPWPSFKQTFSFRKYLTEFRQFLSELPRDFVVISNWGLSDFLLSIFLQVKCLWGIRKIPTKAFEIEGINYNSILRNTLSDYIFNGETLRLLLQNFALTRQLSSVGNTSSPNLLITYSHLFPETRLLSSSIPFGWRHFVFQHAVDFKNKFSNYFRTEHLQNIKLPDIYFTQGDGFRDILESFFPKERIRLIGGPKYDNYYGKIKEIPKGLNTSNYKTILIAPSLEDTQVIFSLLKDIPPPHGWKFLFKPHPALPAHKYEGILDKVSFSIEVTQKPIWNLLPRTDLVVFNYSSVGLEAAFWGVPAVRISSKKVFEVFDTDPNIPCFYAPQEFSKYLEENTLGNVEETIRFYFHKFDGMCYQRFWSEIQKEVQKNET